MQSLRSRLKGAFSASTSSSKGGSSDSKPTRPESLWAVLLSLKGKKGVKVAIAVCLFLIVASTLFGVSPKSLTHSFSDNDSFYRNFEITSANSLSVSAQHSHRWQVPEGGPLGSVSQQRTQSSYLKRHGDAEDFDDDDDDDNDNERTGSRFRLHSRSHSHPSNREERHRARIEQEQRREEAKSRNLRKKEKEEREKQLKVFKRAYAVKEPLASAPAANLTLLWVAGLEKSGHNLVQSFWMHLSAMLDSSDIRSQHYAHWRKLVVVQNWSLFMRSLRRRWTTFDKRLFEGPLDGDGSDAKKLTLLQLLNGESIGMALMDALPESESDSESSDEELQGASDGTGKNARDAEFAADAFSLQKAAAGRRKQRMDKSELSARGIVDMRDRFGDERREAGDELQHDSLDDDSDDDSVDNDWGETRRRRLQYAQNGRDDMKKRLAEIVARRRNRNRQNVAQNKKKKVIKYKRDDDDDSDSDEEEEEEEEDEDSGEEEEERKSGIPIEGDISLEDFRVIARQSFQTHLLDIELKNALLYAYRKALADILAKRKANGQAMDAGLGTHMRRKLEDKVWQSVNALEIAAKVLVPGSIVVLPWMSFPFGSQMGPELADDLGFEKIGRMSLRQRANLPNVTDFLSVLNTRKPSVASASSQRKRKGKKKRKKREGVEKYFQRVDLAFLRRKPVEVVASMCIRAHDPLRAEPNAATDLAVVTTGMVEVLDQLYADSSRKPARYSDMRGKRQFDMFREQQPADDKKRNQRHKKRMERCIRDRKEIIRRREELRQPPPETSDDSSDESGGAFDLIRGKLSDWGFGFGRRRRLLQADFGFDDVRAAEGGHFLLRDDGVDDDDVERRNLHRGSHSQSRGRESLLKDASDEGYKEFSRDSKLSQKYSFYGKSAINLAEGCLYHAELYRQSLDDMYSQIGSAKEGVDSIVVVDYNRLNGPSDDNRLIRWWTERYQFDIDLMYEAMHRALGPKRMSDSEKVYVPSDEIEDFFYDSFLMKSQASERYEDYVLSKDWELLPPKVREFVVSLFYLRCHGTTDNSRKRAKSCDMLLDRKWPSLFHGIN